MRGLLIALCLLAASAAQAQVTRLDGPFSWCSVENRTRTVVRCDHVFPLEPHSGPAYHVRWTVRLNPTGGTRCITWEVYRPSATGDTVIASESIGRAC